MAGEILHYIACSISQRWVHLTWPCSHISIVGPVGGQKLQCHQVWVFITRDWWKERAKSIHQKIIEKQSESRFFRNNFKKKREKKKPKDTFKFLVVYSHIVSHINSSIEDLLWINSFPSLYYQLLVNLKSLFIFQILAFSHSRWNYLPNSKPVKVLWLPDHNWKAQEVNLERLI